MKFYVQVFLISIICLKCVLISMYLFQQPFTSFFTGAVAIAASEPGDSLDMAVSSEDTASSSAGSAADLDAVPLPEAVVKWGEEQAAIFEEKEKFLARREQQLLLLQDEINKKIEDLTRLREEIREQMEIKRTAKENQVKHLIKIYSTMKPQKVAQLIEKLDINLITELFSRMKGDVVGQILSFVDTEIGARITQGLFPEEMEEKQIP